MLILQHHATFYRFMNGLENILDLYRDKGEDEYFHKVTDVRELATKRQPGLILNLRNGFYVTQAGISARYMAAQSNDQREFEQFMQSYKPVVDERELVPREVNITKRIFGYTASLDLLSKDSLMNRYMRDYNNLENAFYNMDDRQRAMIGTNFGQGDPVVDDFLVYK